MSYGDKYLKIISKGLKKINHIQDYDLTQNRISENGAKILNIVTPKAINLNLSKNHIGISGIQ